MRFLPGSLTSLWLASFATLGDAAFLQNLRTPLAQEASKVWKEDGCSVTQDILDEARRAVQKDAQSESEKLKELYQGSKELSSEKLASIFENTYRFSIDHSYKIFDEDKTVFVNTGDIAQMWLRDSSFQMHVYLKLAKKSAEGSAIRRVLEAAMARQRRFILDDNYGSAFYESHGPGIDEGPNKNSCPPSADCPDCSCSDCAPACGRYTYQKDFELDSLLFPLLLHYNYWKETGSTNHFNQELVDVMKASMKVMRVEQNHQSQSQYYYKPVDGQVSDGIGLVWSFALPSDDQAGSRYNIPENIMAANVLQKAAEIAEGPLKQPKLAKDMRALSAEIDAAVNKYGVVKDKDGKDMFCFSTDGKGMHDEFDDANLPNLLWLPYLKLDTSREKDSVYETTRRFVLSTQNKNYFGVGQFHGLGSQHLTENNCGAECIWHLGLAMQGLTATSRAEKVKVMNELLDSDADTHLMHEGFSASDPRAFNRKEFGWADSMFAEWVLRDWANEKI
jgi:hypothetical protein